MHVTQRLNRWLALPLLLLLAVQVSAQTNAAPAARHMLWAVSGPSNTVYLEGSIHLLKPGHYPLPSPMEQAYAESQVLVTEVDLASMRTPDAQLALLTRGRLPAGQSLRDVLSADTYENVARRFANMGLPLETVQTFKPWLLALTLSVLEMQKLGYSPEQGLDAYFDARARRDGKPVLALETLDEQLELFDALAATDAEALLQYTLNELDTLETELDRLVAAWVHADISELEEILLEGFAMFPHLEDNLLTNRNQAWVRIIEQYLQEDRNHLVVVGAGHLIGSQSVIALLQARGFRVEQR